jgi:hypothetical protein
MSTYEHPSDIIMIDDEDFLSLDFSEFDNGVYTDEHKQNYEQIKFSGVSNDWNNPSDEVSHHKSSFLSDLTNKNATCDKIDQNNNGNDINGNDDDVIEFNTGLKNSKNQKKNKQIFNQQFERNDGHILDTNPYNNDNNSYNNQTDEQVVMTCDDFFQNEKIINFDDENNDQDEDNDQDNFDENLNNNFNKNQNLEPVPESQLRDYYNFLAAQLNNDGKDEVKHVSDEDCEWEEHDLVNLDHIKSQHDENNKIKLKNNEKNNVAVLMKKNEQNSSINSPQIDSAVHSIKQPLLLLPLPQDIALLLDSTPLPKVGLDNFYLIFDDEKNGKNNFANNEQKNNSIDQIDDDFIAEFDNDFNFLSYDEQQEENIKIAKEKQIFRLEKQRQRLRKLAEMNVQKLHEQKELFLKKISICSNDLEREKRNNPLFALGITNNNSNNLKDVIGNSNIANQLNDELVKLNDGSFGGNLEDQ